MTLLKPQSQRDCMFIEMDTFIYTFDSEGVVWSEKSQFAINIRLRRSRMERKISICYTRSTPKESILKQLYFLYFFAFTIKNQ